MQTKRRFWTLVIVSLLWALAVSWVFYRVAGRAGTRARAAEPEKPLVVAAVPLPLGAMLTKDSVKLRPTPERLYPSGGFSRIEDVVDRPVVSPIEAGEPVVETRISGRGTGMGLAPMIPNGMRAISVRVNDVAGVAGFVLPGMRVDVLVTGRPPGHDDTYTRTVLQDVTVLSAGQTIQTDGKNPAINTPVVTLLVKPGDAEALTLASTEGHIQLVLRNSADRELATTGGRQLRELYGAAPAQAAPAAAIAVPAKVRKGPRPENPPPPPAPKIPEAVQAPPRQEIRMAPPETVTLIRGSVKTQEAPPPVRSERP